MLCLVKLVDRHTEATARSGPFCQGWSEDRIGIGGLPSQAKREGRAPHLKSICPGMLAPTELD